MESGDSRSDDDDDELEDRLAVSETSEFTEALPSSSNAVGVSRASFNTHTPLIKLSPFSNVEITGMVFYKVRLTPLLIEREPTAHGTKDKAAARFIAIKRKASYGTGIIR